MASELPLGGLAFPAGPPSVELPFSYQHDVALGPPQLVMLRGGGGLLMGPLPENRDRNRDGKDTASAVGSRGAQGRGRAREDRLSQGSAVVAGSAEKGVSATGAGGRARSQASLATRRRRGSPKSFAGSPQSPLGQRSSGKQFHWVGGEKSGGWGNRLGPTELSWLNLIGGYGYAN